jgi:ubiquinone/menaquinone biosynthesis C-methylase UbiE
MRCLRQKFYDFFSGWYDGFVRLHSGDDGRASRGFLVKQIAPQPRDRLLDLCTGTGEVALKLARPLEGDGQVVGLDISRGMLTRARRKQAQSGISGAFWIQGDAKRLPLKSASVTGVTCSHALYELKGPHRGQTLEEVARVLTPGGRFGLMEHAIPSDTIPRVLLRLRSIWTGGIRGPQGALGSVHGLKRKAQVLAPGQRSWLGLWTRIPEEEG